MGVPLTAALIGLSARTTVVAFSNADLAELDALSRNADLSWRAVFSAEFAHSFKPHPAVYRSALNRLPLDPARTMVVAAHLWILRAAAHVGMLTAYISRPHAEAPTPEDRFTVTATDLADLHKQLDLLR